MPISGTGFKSIFIPKFDAEHRIRQMFSRAKVQGSHYQSTRGSEYDGLTAHGIAKKWENNRDRGTAIHAVIEKFYDWYGHLKLSADEIRYLLKQISLELGFPMPDGMIYLVGGQLASLQSVWKIYRVEWVIFDEELGIAGTIDAVFVRQTVKGPKYLIVDWKSRLNINVNQSESHCYKPFTYLKACPLTEYQLQLSNYADFARRKYGLDVEGVAAVVIVNDAIRLFKLEMLDMTEAYEIYSNDLKKLEIFKEGMDKISGLKYPEEKEPEFKSFHSLKETEFIYDEDQRRGEFEASSSKRRKY